MADRAAGGGSRESSSSLSDPEGPSLELDELPGDVADDVAEDATEAATEDTAEDTAEADTSAAKDATEDPAEDTAEDPSEATAGDAADDASDDATEEAPHDDTLDDDAPEDASEEATVEVPEEAHEEHEEVKQAGEVDVGRASESTASHQPDYLVLTEEHVQKIEDFRARLQQCGSETERHKLCTRKRAELLGLDDCAKVLIAGYDNAMSEECASYVRDKAAIEQGDNDDVTDASALETFMASATEGNKCLSTLRTVSRVWGLDRIRYYQWAYRGQFYSNKLRGAALGVNDWDEARVKLNRLIHRWSQQSGRRCKVEESVNPVKPDDLISLKSWAHKRSFVKKNDPSGVSLPYRQLSESDLPEGYGFDKFGLMVHEAYAVTFSSPAPNRGNSKKAKRASSAAATPASKRRSSVKASVSNKKVTKISSTSKRNPRRNGVAPIARGGAKMNVDDDETNDDDDDTISVASSDVGKTLDERLDGPWRDALRRRGDDTMPVPQPKKTAKPKQIKLTEVTWKVPKQCCKESVPGFLVAVLDNRLTCSIAELMEHGSAHLEGLCVDHVKKYIRLLSIRLPNGAAPPIEGGKVPDAAPQNGHKLPEVVIVEEPVQMTNGRRRRRANSLPDISAAQHVAKRPRLSDPSEQLLGEEKEQSAKTTRIDDPDGDDEYRRLWLEDFKQKVRDEEFVPGSRGFKTGTLLWKILQRAKPPSTDNTSEKGCEAYFLDGAEALARVESGVHDEPIFSMDQQPFQWSGDGCRPIAQILRRIQDMGQSVSVQIPSRSDSKHSFQRRKLTEVRERFLHGEAGSEDPWNILDLRSPLPPCILPRFLTGENCQLLPRIRDAVLSPECAERVFASREEWNEWTDVLEWVLLSQGGHNTAPHVDSHGLATWITAQEGRIGFGWMSRPSVDERVEWMENFDNHTKGEWRFVVLKPGQTVFFNSGTIHFVFRAGSEQTLALGGHVLQWTGVERWIRIVIDEMKHPWATNEEMSWSAPNYVRVVAELVRKKVKEGRTDEMGGEAVVGRFFDLVKEFGKLLYS